MREYLEEYAGRRQEQIEAARRIIESSRNSTSGSGPGGRKWKREDAYEERLGRYPNRKCVPILGRTLSSSVLT